MGTSSPDWRDDVYRELAACGVSQVAYVPDAGHARLLDLCAADNAMRMVPLTTEEEGVALLSGAWLGGARGVLLMQSSGVGNCINMLGLAATCRFPVLVLVAMRGEWGEFNPWQMPMGQATPTALDSVGVITYPVTDGAAVATTVAAAARMAFEGLAATAVLISQRVIGVKTFEEPGR